MPDFAAQRLTMVDAQVRTNDVTDPRIHAAMRLVPRERFVPRSKQAMAYADAVVEVAPGRFLPDPRTFAKLLQLAAIEDTDAVLDVACATGYSSAILARLARSVVALEQDADLVRVAVDALRAAGATGVDVVQGQLAEGVRGRAPFDVIFTNGAVTSRPERLLAQLAEGGRLVTVVQDDAQGRAHLFVRRNGQVGARPDFDASLPILPGFKKSVGFVF
jgi:protein-L-isoaspartate(D-aspartate) O-methyltransferase